MPSFPAVSRRHIAPAILATCIASALCAALPRPAHAQTAAQVQPHHYDIPAQPLLRAVQRYSRTSGQQVVVDEGTVGTLQSAPVNGEFTAEAALRQLLQGTGLTFRRERANTVTLVAVQTDEGEGEVIVTGALSVLGDDAVHWSRTENSGSYTPDVVTVGGKVEQSLREVPRSISTITRTQIEDQGMTTLEDALEQLPGVTVSPAAMWSGATYTTRGFTIQNFLVDGSIVREYDAMDSSLNGSLGMYDSVQLLRGPDATFSGQSGSGGTINLMRKRPTHDFQAKGSLSVGSWNNYMGEADISSPLNASGSVRGRVVASYNDKEEFWDNAQSKRSLFYGVVDVDLAPRSTLTVGASRNRQWGTGGISAPGMPRYTNGSPLPLPRSIGTVAYDYRDTDTETYFGTFNHRFGNNWKLKAGVARTENSTDLRFSRINGAVAPGATTGSSVMVRGGQSESRSNSFDFNLGGDFGLLDRHHSFVLGGDYINTHRSDDRGPQNFILPNGRTGNLPIDWANWDPTAVHGLTPAQTNQAWSARSVSQGLYGYGKFQIHGPVKLMLGGRYSDYRKTEDHARLPNQTIQKSTGTFSPYSALMVDIGRQWTAYLTTARGIRDQSNYYTPEYRPMDEVKTRSYELGLKGELMEGRLNTNITLYDMKRSNAAVRLFTDPDFDEEGRSCCYTGADKQTSRGVEIEASGAITLNWQINAGYTYDSNEQAYGASDGNRYTSYTPRHKLNLWTSYRLGGAASGWRVGGGARFQSNSYESGTVRTWNEAKQDYTGPSVAYSFFSPGRAVYSLFGSYQINRNWDLALNVDNAFDKKYFRAVGDTSGGNVYGAPSSFRATLRATF